LSTIWTASAQPGPAAALAMVDRPTVRGMVSGSPGQVDAEPAPRCGGDWSDHSGLFAGGSRVSVLRRRPPERVDLRRNSDNAGDQGE
jgi:hypothetical protein